MFGSRMESDRGNVYPGPTAHYGRERAKYNIPPSFVCDNVKAPIPYVKDETPKTDPLFFSSGRRHTRWTGDWSSDVCSSDLLLGWRLVRPELPPELVGHDRLVAAPARGAEQLAEDHLRVPGRQRRVPGLVVVARVVEEVDACLARGPHDADALIPADPFVGTPGPERQPAHLQVAAAQGGH